VEVSVDNHRAILTDPRPILEGLLALTGASRVTLRAGEGFPVVEEVLAPGAGSIRNERTIDLSQQPVALEVTVGNQVVHDDSASTYDDPEYHRMREVYGGLAAQIVTPVVVGDRVAGILSLHQLGEARHWRPDEVQACRRVAAQLAKDL
jgi:GAF domain-containing protein